MQVTFESINPNAGGFIQLWSISRPLFDRSIQILVSLFSSKTYVGRFLISLSKYWVIFQLWKICRSLFNQSIKTLVDLFNFEAYPDHFSINLSKYWRVYVTLKHIQVTFWFSSYKHWRVYIILKNTQVSFWLKYLLVMVHWKTELRKYRVFGHLSPDFGFAIATTSV